MPRPKPTSGVSRYSSGFCVGRAEARSLARGGHRWLSQVVISACAVGATEAVATDPRIVRHRQCREGARRGKQGHDQSGGQTDAPAENSAHSGRHLVFFTIITLLVAAIDRRRRRHRRSAPVNSSFTSRNRQELIRVHLRAAIRDEGVGSQRCSTLGWRAHVTSADLFHLPGSASTHRAANGRRRGPPAPDELTQLGGHLHHRRQSAADEPLVEGTWPVGLRPARSPVLTLLVVRLTLVG